MLAVANIFNFFIPAISTIFTFVVLFWSWTRGASCYDCRRVGPTARCSLIDHRHREPDNKIIRTHGHESFYPGFPSWQPVLNGWR